MKNGRKKMDRKKIERRKGRKGRKRNKWKIKRDMKSLRIMELKGKESSIRKERKRNEMKDRRWRNLGKEKIKKIKNEGWKELEVD